MATYSKMVCLVGENPLPIWLGIQQFMPPFKETEQQTIKPRVIFVYSNETSVVAEHLHQQLSEERKQKLHEIECIFDDRGKVQNAFSPESMRSTLAKLGGLTEYALNYTGGTKVMSAYFFHEWKSTGRGKDAFYLEEASGKFHFDQGSPHPLEAGLSQLTLETLERLHGADAGSLRKEVPCDLDECARFYRAYDDKTLANLVPTSLCGTNDKAIRSFFEKQANGGVGWKSGDAWDRILQFISEPFRSKWQTEPLYTNQADKTFNQALDAQFRFVVKNEWMEWLIVRLLEQFLSPGAIVTGKKFMIEGQEFEADVLAVHRNRLFYFSVTTQKKPDACKEKMFEAIHRSRQLGGALARSCTICLADKFNNDETGEKDIDTVLAIRKSLTGREDVGNHTIFGLNDVNQWVDSGYANALERFVTQ